MSEAPCNGSTTSTALSQPCPTICDVVRLHTSILRPCAPLFRLIAPLSTPERRMHLRCHVPTPATLFTPRPTICDVVRLHTSIVRPCAPLFRLIAPLSTLECRMHLRCLVPTPATLFDPCPTLCDVVRLHTSILRHCAPLCRLIAPSSTPKCRTSSATIVSSRTCFRHGSRPIYHPYGDALGLWDLSGHSEIFYVRPIALFSMVTFYCWTPLCPCPFPVAY
jgi:hypothetical protein